MCACTSHALIHNCCCCCQGDEQLKQQREHTKQEELAKLFNASKNCNGAVAVNGTT